MTAKSLKRLLCNWSCRSIVIITNKRAGDAKTALVFGNWMCKGEME